MNFTETFRSLNESQKAAVTTTEGPVLVVAGPGTGKTLTIVCRIAHLLIRGVRPENILAVTFTNRAAREMRGRTLTLVGEGTERMHIGTFHLLGLGILRENLAEPFVLYNRTDQISLIRSILQGRKKGKLPPGHSPARVAEMISGIKSAGKEIPDAIRGLYEEYQSVMRKHSALDFDDLIVRPVEIIEDRGLHEYYRRIFRYMIVDEYQDINPLQYRLLSLLAGSSGNICAVGDPDQAIYAFRGSDIAHFINFTQDFTPAKSITLGKNYRSTGTLIHASGSLISHNSGRLEKKLVPAREHGSPVVVVSAPHERAEGEFIIREIGNYIGITSHTQFMRASGSSVPSEVPFGFSDFAVIFRTNGQAKGIEEVFASSGIPFQRIGSHALARRQGDRDILAYLRILVNPSDDASFRDILAADLSGVSPAEREKLLDLAALHRMTLYETLQLPEIHTRSIRALSDTVGKLLNAKSTQPLNEFLETVFEHSGVKEYSTGSALFALIRGLSSAYRHYSTPDALERVVNEVSLLTPADDFDPRAQAVTLMTLHMAKGLEFRVVFITGVEEGLIPYSIHSDTDSEEERRLFYVGMTRAKDALYLLHSRKRFLYGQLRSPFPSPFLREIPDACVERIVMPERRKKQKDSQIGLF